MMKPLLCTLGLMVLSLPALATTTIFCEPDPLSDAVVIDLKFGVSGGYGWNEEQDLKLFGGRDEDRRAFVARVTAKVEAQLRAAGYEVDTNSTNWWTDRARYENTGIPHHTLNLFAFGEGIPHENCESTLYVFEVVASLHAEFLTPDMESVETFSSERLNYASESDIETKILEMVSRIVPEMLGAGNFWCRAPRKERLQFNDGKHSLDLTEPGYNDLLRYLRHETSDESATAELFTEPRSRFPEPLAIFPLGARSLPDRLLLSQDARFLVNIGQWPAIRSENYWQRTFIRVLRTDGSLVHRLSLADLLTEKDLKNMHFMFMPPTDWSQEDHFIDESSQTLVLELPPCLVVGGPSYGAECHKGSSEIEIRLEDGQLTQPKQDFLPWMEYRVDLAEVEMNRGKPEPAASRFECRSGWSAESFERVPLVGLESRLPAVSMPMPKYTRIGEMARVVGKVELELLLSSAGEVVCVAATRGLSMGLSEAAEEAALRWLLQPIESAAGLSRTRVSFDFHTVVIAPPVHK